MAVLGRVVVTLMSFVKLWEAVLRWVTAVVGFIPGMCPGWVIPGGTNQIAWYERMIYEWCLDTKWLV